MGSAACFSYGNHGKGAAAPYAAAVAIHRRLPGRYWGISRRQFKDFIEKVREYHDQSKIKNPVAGERHHNSGFGNRGKGPNAHQVTEDVIKPITKDAHIIRKVTGRAGNPVTHLSWALMMNPDGLLCDLFVSHCWDEGIFELEKHLLGLRDSGQCDQVMWTQELNAYICFLANPQTWPREILANLIGARPADSPFADALRQCRAMIMVSNDTTPIHSRLWCVYEAKLGKESGLPIILAGYAECLLPLDDVPAVKNVLQIALESGQDPQVVCSDCVWPDFITRCKELAQELSVQNASCTDPEDEQAIRRDIHGQEQDIDLMIRDGILKAFASDEGYPVAFVMHGRLDLIEPT